MKIQSSVFDDNKLTELFRLCIIIEELSETLIESLDAELESNKHFFFGDILHYFGNAIVSGQNSKQIKQAMCHYLRTFLRRLLPIGSEYVKEHLYFIVSTLVPIIKDNDNEEFGKIALEILRVLLIEHKQVLRDVIALLDHFPLQETFTEMREIHRDIKYFAKSDFSLVEEIEYFLKLENRSIEGLQVLKDQVRTTNKSML